MKTKIKKLFVTVFTVLLSVMCAGCGDLAALKNKYITEIETYYEQLETANLEYSTLFIQYELEKGKEKINAAENSLDVVSEAGKMKSQLRRLTLSTKEFSTLREVFLETHTPYVASTWKPRFYLGEFDGKQVIYAQLGVTTAVHKEQVGAYLFIFRQGSMAFHVIDGEEVYYLHDAYRLGVVNDMQVKNIYEYYQLLRANNIY